MSTCAVRVYRKYHFKLLGILLGATEFMVKVHTFLIIEVINGIILSLFQHMYDKNKSGVHLESI